MPEENIPYSTVRPGESVTWNADLSEDFEFYNDRLDPVAGVGGMLARRKGTAQFYRVISHHRARPNMQGALYEHLRLIVLDVPV